MKISVCITIYNEQVSISKVIEGLLNQSKKPDEIVIVDGGSVDATVKIIQHWQRKSGKIKLVVQKCTPSEGRNLAVELSRNDIIAMTDAGCVAERDWLKYLMAPFTNEKIDIVAGFYTMRVRSPLQKALAVFLGVHPDDFDINYLPSARSIAFRKEAWEKIGGFPEDLDDTAEDTVFNYKALKEDLKIARVSDARVEWREIPNSFLEGVKKIYYYAKGDAKSGIWYYPSISITSHNMKAVLKILRYLLGFSLFVYGLYNPLALLVFLTLLALYSVWSFRKVYSKYKDWKAGIWGIVFQFCSDVVVTTGFLKGVITVSRKPRPISAGRTS